MDTVGTAGSKLRCALESRQPSIGAGSGGAELCDSTVITEGYADSQSWLLLKGYGC